MANKANAIMIDDRDAQYVRLEAFGEVPTMVQRLDVGDAHVACSDGTLLIVERKTDDDLVASIQDKRIYIQAAAMRRMSQWSYVVVTHDLRHNGHNVILGHGLSGWDYAAVQGALLDVQELGVRVVFAANEADYEQCVLRLAARNREATTIGPVRPAYPLTPWQIVLCAIRGIGPKTAHELLCAYPTPAWAITEILNGNAREKGLVDAGQERNCRAYYGVREGYTLYPVEIEESKNGGTNGE